MQAEVGVGIVRIMLVSLLVVIFSGIIEDVINDGRNILLIGNIGGFT